MKTTQLRKLFLFIILAALSGIVHAAYVIHIPTEVKLRGSLPDGSISFVTPTDEPTIPEEPSEPAYKGSVTFSTFSKYTKLGPKFQTILLGYNSGVFSSNTSELPYRAAYPCNPAITTECVIVNDGYSKGAYNVLYNGNNTDIQYVYATKNLIPNQIDIKTFRTSYKNLYVEQNGEMLACNKGDEGFQAINSMYDKYEQYTVTFTCPGNIILPLSNVTFKFN